MSSDSADEFAIPSTSALAPVDSSENEENVEPPCKKKSRKAYTRKREPNKTCPMPLEDDTDREEEEHNSLFAGWTPGQPSGVPVTIPENLPTYTQKINLDCSACDAFSLYYYGEMWKMIVEETNLYALQEMMLNWHTLTVSELKAY